MTLMEKSSGLLEEVTKLNIIIENTRINQDEMYKTIKDHKYETNLLKMENTKYKKEIKILKKKNEDQARDFYSKSIRFQAIWPQNMHKCSQRPPNIPLFGDKPKCNSK